MAKLKTKQPVVKQKKVITKSKKSISKKKLKRAIIKPSKMQEFKSTPLESDSDSEELLKNEITNGNSNEATDEDNASSDIAETGDNSDVESGSEIEDEADKHKRDLEKLKKSDPEFYQFLQENDKKLLDFNLSDDEVEDDDVEKGKGAHQPSATLDVASDESDFEETDETKPKDRSVLTLKTLKKWQSDIRTDKSNKTIIKLTEAFHAALLTVTTGGDEEQEPSNYKVEGSAVFNGVIQLCVLELGPAIRKFLRLQQGSKLPPHKTKKFVKVKRPLKFYFTDLLKLLLGVTSSNIQTVLLKHLHYMSSFLVSYPNITKSLLKRLISLWGTADDSVRVVAFFCILRITNNQQIGMLDTVLKSMYMTYVKNSKFVSLNGLAGINFMRRSLVEMYALDTNVSYQHVFLYIRQLAIHLRNAVTVKKTENVQAVYNWQFVNSLRLWGNLLTVTYNKPLMQQLVYPFVQICLGTIKLIPTAQYYPLRFHIVQILMDLSRDTGVFVPVLPFLLEVLTSYDFNRKHQKVSMKPMHFTCLLRLSKSQLQENGFKDTVIESIYGQLLEYLTTHSYSIGFSDLTLLCVIQIKQFLKQCKNANYNRKLKQVLEKIEQNSQFIEKERSKTTFNIKDFKQIEGWETQIKNKGTPLSTYFESWSKLKTIKKNKQLTNNDQLGDYKLPTIKRIKKAAAGTTESTTAGQVELFPSDSEDDENIEKKPRRGTRGGKKRKKYVDSGPVIDDGQGDIVQDINMDEW